MASVTLTGWTLGFINASGNFDTSNPNTFTSDFVEITASTTYTIKGNSSVVSIKRFAFFDADKNFISREISASTIESPSNAAYARISVGPRTLTEQQLATVYLSYEGEIGGGTDGDQTVNVTAVELDANSITVKVGASINVNATITPSNATDKTVTWSKNNNNVNITTNGLDCSITGVAKGTSNVTVTTNDGSLTATCTVTVIANTSDTTSDTQYINKYNLPWLLNKRSNNMNQYKFLNKKYYSLGDSIVANDGTYKGYQSHIVEQLGVAHTNYGKGGSTVVSMLSGYLALDFTDVALVTIGFGVNDARTGVPLGKLGNYAETSHDTSTFYGAYRTLLDKIYTDNPECRVILLTPLQRLYVTNFGCDTANSNGKYLIDFVDAIIKIGEMYATPVCDMYRESGINQKNLAYYTVEGVHPKDLGYVRMANLILHQIDKF